MTDSHAHRDHVRWGTFRGRPELERLLTELHHVPPGETGQAQRWRRWRIAAGNLRIELEHVERHYYAGDPTLSAELPPGVDGLTHRQAVEAALRGPIGGLADCLPH